MNRRENADNQGSTGRRRTPSGARHLDLATITAYLDGTLDRQERDAVAAHLADCAACRQETAELSTTADLLHELPHYRPSRSFRLDPATARRERGNVVWLGRYLTALPALRAATAAVALLLVTTIVADILTTPDTAPRQDFAVEQAIVTVTVTAGPGNASNETEAIEAAGDAVNEEAPAAASGSQPRAAEAAPAVASATTAPTPEPTPTSVPERSAPGRADDVPWRLIETVLGVTLVLLALALIALQRLRRRLRGRT